MNAISERVAKSIAKELPQISACGAARIRQRARKIAFPRVFSFIEHGGSVNRRYHQTDDG
ncbi:MAG: hypothetical protein ACJ8M1_14875 [Chthoniobacterales bacterium]